MIQLLISIAFLFLVGCAEELPDNLQNSKSSTASQPTPEPVVTPTPAPAPAPAPLPVPQPAPVAPPSIAEFKWSFGGPIGGKYCVQWLESASRFTWDDNFLCSDRDFQITWVSDGVIPVNSYCVKISESAEPALYGWGDNYLCTPTDVGFKWSSAGPIAGMSCLLINEPSDPYTWNDNYLCLPQ